MELPAPHLVCLLLLLAATMSSMAKRVIIVPMPMTSHTKYQTNVAAHVSHYGHEVWVCMPPYIKSKTAFNSPQGYEILEYTSNPVNIEELSMSGMRDMYWENKTEDFSLLLDGMRDHVDKMMKDTKFINDVKSIKPDLIVLDNITPLKMLVVLPYKLGVPFAFLGTWYEPIYHRIPIMPHLTVKPPFPFDGTNLSFEEKLKTFFLHFLHVVFELYAYDDKVVERYAPERPYITLRQLVANAEIYLIEIDHILDYPKPTVPNVKLIGGTSISKPSPLTRGLKAFVENSKDDVVFVSFGTYVNFFPKHVSSKIMNALKKLNYSVVWKTNQTSPLPSKIWTSNWIPQNDLLAHPKVKVFVSHCGKNSQYESLYHGVPFLCFPLFADQFYNAKRASVKGFSLTGDILTITEDDLVNMIHSFGRNMTYRNSMETASQLFRINQGLPVERAAFWLDHVMAFGGGYMRSAGQGLLPTYEYYGLDVLFVLMIVVMGVVIVFGTSCYCCFRIVCRKKKSKVE